jgi:hypothetical protein
MDRALTFLTGAGVGAGLMYVLDPQAGRRRRALARDQAVHLAHEARDAANVVARDMRNRAQGLAAGDLSVLAGGRRARQNPLRGGWSPSARALMTLLGGGLFLYGLTRRAPTACLLGTAGLALTAEGISNAGLEDIRRIPHEVTEKATDLAGRVGLGLGQNLGQREQRPQPAGARS